MSDSEARLYMAAFHKSPVGILILQRKGPEEFVVMDANPASQKAGSWRQYTLEEIIGKIIADSYKGTGKSALLASYNKALNTAKAVHLKELEYESPGVPYGIFDVHLLPLSRNFLLVSFLDIAEHRKAQKALVLQAEKLAHFNAELQKRTTELGVLNEIALAVNSNLNLKQIYQVFVEEVQKLVPFDLMGLGVLIEDGKSARWLLHSFLEQRGQSGNIQIQDLPLNTPNKLASNWVLKNGKTLIRTDWSEEREFPVPARLFEQGIRSDIIVPLIYQGKVEGTFALDSKVPNIYSKRDIPILQQLANQLVVAVRNARLMENLDKERDELELRVEERTAELLRSNAELERSNRELQDFVYVASHDLQEPLRKIQTFGDRLKTIDLEALGAKGSDYLERMQNSARRMQVLINDLLTLSRLTTWTHPFSLVDLAEVIREVVSDLEVRLEQSGGQVKVKDLPPIEADPGQMRQLFQNLISNALKFHREGVPPLVEIRGTLLSAQDERLSRRTVRSGVCRITGEDNGIGFDGGYRERIFVPFQRLHHRSSFDGTGMGLAICRKLVERHGGTIEAESTPGQGATFVIDLPVKQPEGVRRS